MTEEDQYTVQVSQTRLYLRSYQLHLPYLVAADFQQLLKQGSSAMDRLAVLARHLQLQAGVPFACDCSSCRVGVFVLLRTHLSDPFQAY